MNERMTASMTAWERIPATDQVEIVTRAAKRAAYMAGVFGVNLTPDELIGQTWIGTVERLDADRLSKTNERRAAEDKAPLTIMQIAYRAAHTAAELHRYDYNKNSALPLELWTAVDDGDMEDRIINRLAIADCMAGLDSRGRAVAELIIAGHSEREIGKAVGISSVAVHKRVVKTRRDLSEAIA